MSVSTLVKTIVITNSAVGDFKFEIYQVDNSLFYADISSKNSSDKWELSRCDYRITRALDIDDAVRSCIKFVENKEIDMKTAKVLL